MSSRPTPKEIREAIAMLLDNEGIMPVTAVEGHPSIGEAVAGEAVGGSWWGHRASHAIYSRLSALSDSGEVVWVKLLAGKMTAVHQTHWRALLSVVIDPSWRAGRRDRLGEIARALLCEVEAEGRLRMDEHTGGACTTAALKQALRRARITLEQSLLVFSEQLHTDRGYHTIALQTWERWAEPGLLRAAQERSWEEATTTLGAAARFLDT